MEGKREATKQLLAAGLKKLMQGRPLEKITIKMITDEAGVIRPTFYNYFQDKYELLQWIFETEVLSPAVLLIENGMYNEALEMMFKLMDKDKAFYRKALETKGQNSFEEILYKSLYDLYLGLIKKRGIRIDKYENVFSAENLALYYSRNLADVVRFWLTSRQDLAPELIAESYSYLIAHPVFEVLNEKGSGKN